MILEHPMSDVITVVLEKNLYTIWSRGDATELIQRTHHSAEAVAILKALAARIAKTESGDFTLKYYDYKWYDSHHIVAAYSLAHARLLQMFDHTAYLEFDEDTYHVFKGSYADTLTLINYTEPGVY